MTVYRGSDGRRYTDEDVWVHLENDRWNVFCWDTESGLEVMENSDGDLVFLDPIRDERETASEK